MFLFPRANQSSNEYLQHILHLIVYILSEKYVSQTLRPDVAVS